MSDEEWVDRLLATYFALAEWTYELPWWRPFKRRRGEQLLARLRDAIVRLDAQRQTDDNGMKGANL